MMTLSKIAKLANVSVSTASKAFSGSGEVNPETRERVFQVAREHGCFKKFYNAKYPKLVIAIIAPEFRGAYYSKYLWFIQNNLEQENCELCVSSTNFSEEKETALIEYYYRHSGVDGIIVIGAESDLNERYEIPVVFVGPRQKSRYALSVMHSIKPALAEGIGYLLEKGVSSIGFVGESLTTGKLNVFREILEEKGITPEEAFISVSEKRFEEGGYQAMETLFARQTLPRAIVCAYDNMAIGAIRCIHDHGLSVPEDIAVLGMDDNAEAEFSNPPIASISSDIEEICRIATDAILNPCGEDATLHHTITSAFKMRKSLQLD